MNHLSAIPFCHGLRKAVRRGSIPIFLIDSVTRSEKYGIVVVDEEPWSCVSSGKASRSCWTTHDDVGWAVTPKWMISASSVADHKPGVQQSEPNGGDDQEVHRGDAVPVIAKKGLPALALIVIRVFASGGNGRQWRG